MENKLIIESLKNTIKELRDECYTSERIGLEKTALDYVDILEKQLLLHDVSQQRELLIATIEKVRYNLDGYGALTSSEIAERLEKAINCG